MDVSGRFVLLIIYFITILFPTNSFGEKPLTSKFIVVDQFGYRPEGRKIAVIRDPQVGFDAAESFMPGPTYAVVKVNDSTQVLTGAPVTWNNGNTDASSGDKAWWFDFSSVKEEGVYYILDIDSNLCS
ncbi:MAG: hypothetical protein JXR31_02225, partial [Prolixibacteraceae bacterium]|nr:hypothetical protein [Prolixibacteraceae bacterium]